VNGGKLVRLRIDLEADRSAKAQERILGGVLKIITKKYR